MLFMTTMWDQTPGGAVPVFDLGDRTRKAREFSGLDQGQLAERLGVARSTVARMEQGVASWMERGDDLDATELRRYAEDARAQAERARS